jgi:hypothetical protein
MNRLLAQIKSVIYSIGKDKCRYLLIADENGFIQSANKEMRSMRHLSAEEMKKKIFLEFLPACRQTAFERINEFPHRAISHNSQPLILKNKSDGTIICQLHRLLTEQIGKGLFLCTAYGSTRETEDKINHKSPPLVDDSVSASFNNVIVPASQKESLEAANGIKHVTDLPDAGRRLPAEKNKKIVRKIYFFRKRAGQETK